MNLNRAVVSVLSTAMAVAAFNASAEVPPNYIGVLGSYIIPDSTRQDDDGYGAHLLFGAPITDVLTLEVGLFGHTMDHEVGNGSDTGYGLGIDMLAGNSFGPFRLFGLAGFGGTYEDLYDDEEVSPYLDVGLGAILSFTERLSLRAESRYYAIFNNTTYGDENVIGDVRFNVGLQLAFPVPPDAIPEPTPEPQQAPELIPAAPAVLDSDGDGVPDGQDACPDTPPGFKVDARGCVLEQVVVFHNIQFEFDSDKLLPESEIVLRGVADGLKGQPNLKVEVAGHTDWMGSDGYNLGLSEKRARSVKRFLIADGIAEDRLRTVGFGESQPIAPNETDEGRALNRRVEFKVLQK